jgi:peptidoglycan/LPS O-acetylase OafA/YrhL
MNPGSNSRTANLAQASTTRVAKISMITQRVSRYIVLDFMRGFAAVIVLVFHIDYMLASYAPGLQKGYLAVDFFFILSGFVIAANYHMTVSPSISWFDFLSARFSRLWPLFILTTLLGCVVVVTKLTRDSGFFDAYGVFGSLAANSVMLPSFFQAFGVDRLFLFNGASWSVFFELAINIVFFAVLRGLSLKSLSILSVAFAGLLIFVAQDNGSLDGGWAAASFHVGAARVLFGFTAGMAVYLASRKIRFHLNRPLTAVLIACFCLPFFVAGNWLVDCMLVILGFPLLVLLASRCELDGLCARFGSGLGNISYSIYLLQTPFMLFTAGTCQTLFGRNISEFAPLSGVLFAIGMLGVSYLSWHYFERPAQDYLRQRLSAWHKRPGNLSKEAA